MERHLIVRDMRDFSDFNKSDGHLNLAIGSSTVINGSGTTKFTADINGGKSLN